MNQRYLQNMYHAGVNLGLESETAVNISVSVKI